MRKGYGGALGMLAPACLVIAPFPAAAADNVSVGPCRRALDE